LFCFNAARSARWAASFLIEFETFTREKKIEMENPTFEFGNLQARPLSWEKVFLLVSLIRRSSQKFLLHKFVKILQPSTRNSF
jgi:hypothetical protein